MYAQEASKTSMKIGILTASRTNNNGTDLQALAMQWLFEQFSGNVEIINYKCKKLENSRKIFYPKSIRGFVEIPYSLQNHIAHELFRARFFHYSQKVYDADTISESDYDLIVSGSDQIWNLDITGGDLNYFLPFAYRGVKSSYAASIGHADITEWERKYGLSNFLRDLQSVSVREQSAVEALEQIGISAHVDLDPLLMIPVQRWNQVKESLVNKRKYIFVYVVDRGYESIDYAKAYARENDCEVIYYGNLLKPVPGIKVERFSNIGRWVSLLANAELVVTNSYHGLSFAINYQKPFAIPWLRSSKQSNTRMESLLMNMGISECADKQICTPDWANVDNRLAQLRVKSLEYVKTMVETK